MAEPPKTIKFDLEWSNKPGTMSPLTLETFKKALADFEAQRTIPPPIRCPGCFQRIPDSTYERHRLECTVQVGPVPPDKVEWSAEQRTWQILEPGAIYPDAARYIRRTRWVQGFTVVEEIVSLYERKRRDEWSLVREDKIVKADKPAEMAGTATFVSTGRSSALRPSDWNTRWLEQMLSDMVPEAPKPESPKKVERQPFVERPRTRLVGDEE